MCGRFAFSAKTESLEQLVPNIKVSANIVARYNIAPSQNINAITFDKGYEVRQFAWGLIPSWAKDKTIGSRMINARAETLFEKPAFKNLITKKRCLIITSGYFEWQNIPGQTRKQPYYIYLKNKELFTFAGLWDRWISPESEIVESATIITCEPNESIKFIHNRMPVIIPEDKRNNWLASETTKVELIKMLNSTDSTQIAFHPVSYAVNNPGNDSVECIRPIMDGN